MTSTVRPQEYGGSNRYRRDSPAASRAFAPISAGAPSITDNTSATSTLTNPKQWLFTAPAAGSSDAGGIARISGLNRFINRSTYNNAIAPDPTLVGPGGNQYWSITFDTDAPVFELDYYGIVGPMELRLWIDDQLINTSPIILAGSGGAMHKLLVAATSNTVKVRRIRVQGENVYLAGVTTTKADTVWAPPAPQAKVCWITDSYGQYQGFDAFHFVASRLLGWDHVDMNTIGGTGYNNTGGGTDYRFQTRAADVISGGYDIVLPCGGINDALTGLQGQAAALFSTLQTGLPNAKIIAVGPWTPPTANATQAAQKQAAIAAAGAAANITVIDPTTWYTGTGNYGTPTGDGNADRYIVAGGTHPTLDGAKYLGSRLASAIITSLKA